MTLGDVIVLIEKADLTAIRKRDQISAINRICVMAATSPAHTPATVDVLRPLIDNIQPAAHNISAKTFSNLRCSMNAALAFAGIIDIPGRGRTKHDRKWGPLFKAIKGDTRFETGLACFANWCVFNRLLPHDVTDDAVERFLHWLETRTLRSRPRDLVRRVPNLWNEAVEKVDLWPRTRLSRLSFRATPEHLGWHQMPESLVRDVEDYLAKREDPDIFDDSPNVPRRPLASSTIRQQREHLRLAASVLSKSGRPIETITSLGNLVEPEAFKTILRHYHRRNNGAPNAFLTGLAKTLIQVARYHAGVTDEELGRLKALAGKLQPVPNGLTDKNKALLRHLESDDARRKLMFLPDRLLKDVVSTLENGRLRFVEAQVAIAVDIVINAPLRPQNLADLNWARHFSEVKGSSGPLALHIPAPETKTKKRDLSLELPEETARRLRWYRRHILPRLGADPNRALFVTHKGHKKKQATLTAQIIKLIERHVGIHMTPHQFRHFAAASYLDENPEDLESVRALLGHAYAKTTLIYAGASSRRASRAYGRFVVEQRKELKLKTRKRPRRSRNAKPPGGRKP
jgi:integrase